MIQSEHLEHILFIDIETVSCFPDWASVPQRNQTLWARKAETLQRGLDTPVAIDQLYTDRAAIFAEFGRVVCISAGFLRAFGKKYQLRLKSFASHDEAQLLQEFGQIADQFMTRPIRNLCAHNGKEFDFPYLGRRFLVHGLPLPRALRVQGKKPWEIPFLDTMDLWRFGDHRTYVSLDLLADTLNIPSPKSDMTGADVGTVYWQDKDLNRIKRYCELDVVATAQIMLHFCGESIDLELDHADQLA
ncbi:MAG: ribonuclease H-like domain-containing protein [Acidobacteria bacterium]|nr:ribonuclease H-like domain-containing protein [Acidobacteriota bacterium]